MSVPPTISHAVQQTQYRLSGLISWMRWATNMNISPRFVHFDFPQPADLSPYYRVFQAPCLFRQGESALIIDARDIHAPLVSSNSLLAGSMEDKAREVRAAWQDEGLGLAGHARAAIREMLQSSQPPQISAVGERLNLPPHTLRRRLQESGLQFRNLVDEERLAICRKLLADPAVNLEEVASRLGYSNKANFHRAFHRWTGSSPAKTRRTFLRGEKAGAAAPIAPP